MRTSVSRRAQYVVSHFVSVLYSRGQEGLLLASEALDQLMAIICGPETPGHTRRGCHGIDSEIISEGTNRYAC